jgi:Mg-chelatase subunit ChlD
MEANDQLTSPGNRDEKAGPASLVVIILTLAVAFFLSQSNFNSWIKLFGCLVDAAFVVLGAPWVRRRVERLLDLGIDFARTIHPPRPPVPVIVAGGVGVALVATLTVVVTWPRPHPELPPGCPEPSEVRVLTSTDSQEWVRRLFDAYARSTDTAGDRCPTVHPVVYAAPTAAAISALATTWNGNDTQNPLRDIGPRPDVWLPDAAADVAAMLSLARRSGYQLPVPVSGTAVTPGAVTSIGSSPIVLAARGAPPASWPDAFTAGTGLAAADPNLSTTGEFAMVSYLRGGTGFVGPTEARHRVQAVATSAAALGADSVTSLCQAGRDPTTTAVITSRQLWQLYGTGGPLAATCPGGRPDFTGWSEAPAGDGLVLDHPLVVPTWTWLEPVPREAAQRIQTWLRGQDGKAALNEAGLDAAALGATCLAPGATFAPTSCVPVDPAAAKALYESAKSPGRVLMLMDASGSMSDPATTGGTRFSVAASAFAQALGQIGPEDEFGLWTFSGDRRAPWHPLADIAPGTAAQRTAATTALGGVKPSGNTPLYAAISAGLDQIGQAATFGRTSAVVVLTDGQDTTSGLTLQQTQAKIASVYQAKGVRLFIVAIGEAACEGAQGLSALTEGHGTCLDARLDEVSSTMAQLFESIWKGQ